MGKVGSNPGARISGPGRAQDKMSASGKRHMARVAELGQSIGCVVCGGPFAHVHHILEGRTPGRRSGDFCTVNLCFECHEGAHGIHGDRLRWALHKKSELGVLNEVLEAIYGGAK